MCTHTQDTTAYGVGEPPSPASTQRPCFLHQRVLWIGPHAVVITYLYCFYVLNTWGLLPQLARLHMTTHCVNCYKNLLASQRLGECWSCFGVGFPPAPPPAIFFILFVRLNRFVIFKPVLFAGAGDFVVCAPHVRHYFCRYTGLPTLSDHPNRYHSPTIYGSLNQCNLIYFTIFI